MINVLLTGSGSIIAMGYIQSLRESKLDIKIIAADIANDAIGLYKSDKGYIVPPVSNQKEYITQIKDICKKEDIDIIFIGCTAELEPLSLHKEEIESETKAIVVVNSPKVLEIGSDKWKTQEFLQSNRFNYARSTIDLSEDNLKKFISEVDLPVVAKPRMGQNSVGIFVYDNIKDLIYDVKKLKNYIIQEYLPEDEGEYTVGVLTGRNNKILNTIILKRKLQPRWGVSVVAKPLNNKKIKQYCEDVSIKLNSFGPCNFQLRLKNGEPYIFEINPRFSSTSHMRTILGANELEMLVKDLVLYEEVITPRVKEGAVVRYVDDFLISEDKLKEMQIFKN